MLSLKINFSKSFIFVWYFRFSLWFLPLGVIYFFAGGSILASIAMPFWLIFLLYFPLIFIYFIRSFTEDIRIINGKLSYVRFFSPQFEIPVAEIQQLKLKEVWLRRFVSSYRLVVVDGKGKVSEVKVGRGEWRYYSQEKLKMLIDALCSVNSTIVATKKLNNYLDHNFKFPSSWR